MLNQFLIAISLLNLVGCGSASFVGTKSKDNGSNNPPTVDIINPGESVDTKEPVEDCTKENAGDDCICPTEDTSLDKFPGIAGSKNNEEGPSKCEPSEGGNDEDEKPNEDEDEKPNEDEDEDGKNEDDNTDCDDAGQNDSSHQC